jgi:transposase
LHQGSLLDGWGVGCQASGIPELAPFAVGLLREYEWVVAGITHLESLGLVEGFVNKVKLVKRVLFGKAGFPL